MRYDAAADRLLCARIISVKLDGKELLGTEFMKACDTDEGWVDCFETEMVNGKRRLKCGPWYEDKSVPKGQGAAIDDTLTAVIPGRMKRDILTKRLTGKVEVTLSPLSNG